MSGSDPRAGQETARLLAAAQDWLRTSAPHLAPRATDGEPCSCPVCRGVAGLREADPDSVGRWVDSAVAALGSLVTQAGDLAAAQSRRPPQDDSDESSDESGPDVPDEGTHDPGARQDEPAPRRVRRVTLDPRVEDPGRQDR